MSYDVSVRMETGNGSYLEAEPEGGGNYTYNCGPMLKEATRGTGLSDLHGQLAKDVASILQGAIIVMKMDRPRFEAMNPKNGWGDYVSWVQYLQRIVDLCMKHPLATFNVS